MEAGHPGRAGRYTKKSYSAQPPEFVTALPHSDRHVSRAAFAGLLAACLLAAGCSVRLHGAQSAGGGSSATATSSELSGSARFSGGKASFSSGGQGSSQAGGGHVSLGRGPTAVLIVGLMIADAVDYFSGRSGAPARREAAGDSILETCSCYRKPVASDQ